MLHQLSLLAVQNSRGSFRFDKMNKGWKASILRSTGFTEPACGSHLCTALPGVNRDNCHTAPQAIPHNMLITVAGRAKGCHAWAPDMRSMPPQWRMDLRQITEQPWDRTSTHAEAALAHSGVALLAESAKGCHRWSQTGDLCVSMRVDGLFAHD